jgi:hypothetical protein
MLVGHVAVANIFCWPLAKEVAKVLLFGSMSVETAEFKDTTNVT